MLDKLAGRGKTNLAADAAWKIGRGWRLSFYRVGKKPSLRKEPVEPNLGAPKGPRFN